MTNINDIAITSLETITAFDVVTGNYKFTLDELQKATISQSQETTDITGKAGRKLSTLKRNKAVKVSGTNGLLSGGLIEAQTGSSFENKVTEVMWTDYLTVAADTEGTGVSATTTYKAVGTTGAEIEALYIRDPETGALGTQLTQGSAVGKEVFTYNPNDKTLAFSADVTAGTEIVVYYKRKIQADVHTNESDEYSTKCALFIDALGEDKCSNVYRIQIYIPKADFSGELSLDFGDSQTVHAFEAESLTGGCGIGGVLWTYTVFGTDAADAT